MEKVSNCPVCTENEFTPYLSCVDYLVSKEKFKLVRCTQCGFVFTNPRPGPEQIAPYYNSEEYYSHSDQKKSIVAIVYNFIRKINISYKRKILQKHTPEGCRHMDYGAGVGYFVQACKTNGFNSFGYEPNEKARTIACKSGLDIMDLDNFYNIKSDSVDVISMWHVLEHIHNLDEVLQKMVNALTKDGTMVLAVPNIESWDSKYYKEKWAAFDVPRHLYHFSSSTIDMLFDRFGMQIVDIHPLKFDAYYISLLSEKEGFSKFFKAFVNGLRSNMAGKKTNIYSSTIYVLKRK